MLTIEQIADQTDYTVEQLTEVLNVWGNWSYDYMVYTGHREVLPDTFEMYMYLWKNLVHRYSSLENEYLLEVQQSD